MVRAFTIWAVVSSCLVAGQDEEIDETSLCLGDVHTCAVVKRGGSFAGDVECWGGNQHGQAEPPKGSTNAFVQIACGKFHTCGLTVKGTVQCWGAIKTAPQTPFVQISAGGKYTCGITSKGKVQCWGTGPRDVKPAHENLNFKHISVGSKHICGLLRDGSCQCWGDEKASIMPPGILNKGFVQVSLSHGNDAHTCALKRDGSAHCWGSDGFSQCMAQNVQFSQICAGERYNCGIAKGTGTLHCWGETSELGPLPSTGKFDLIACGARHICVRSSKGFSCFGRNKERYDGIDSALA